MKGTALSKEEMKKLKADEKKREKEEKEVKKREKEAKKAKRKTYVLTEEGRREVRVRRVDARD